MNCPMCESSRKRKMARCPCEVADVRRGLLLLTLGWAGDQREFRKEDRGWRLGNGIVATPWLKGVAPDDPWDALDQIEAHKAEEVILLLELTRVRIGALLPPAQREAFVRELEERIAARRTDPKVISRQAQAREQTEAVSHQPSAVSGSADEPVEPR